MSKYEFWVLLIGVATLLVALATFLYVLCEKRINVKVSLQVSGSTPPISTHSSAKIYLNLPCHLYVKAEIQNSGENSVVYRNQYLYINNQRVILQPFISPHVFSSTIKPHLQVSFSYDIYNKQNNVPGLIENQKRITLRFGITLHDGRERMSNAIPVDIIEKYTPEE